MSLKTCSLNIKEKEKEEKEAVASDFQKQNQSKMTHILAPRLTQKGLRGRERTAICRRGVTIEKEYHGVHTLERMGVGACLKVV